MTAAGQLSFNWSFDEPASGLRFCVCRIPARSPRAEGPDHCQTCKRPIAPCLADEPPLEDDLADLTMPPPTPAERERFEWLEAKHSVQRPQQCCCDHPAGQIDDDGDVRCVMCGRRPRGSGDVTGRRKAVT